MKSQFTGETMIFRNDDKGFPIYKTSLGSKNAQGEWDNAYIDVKFKKGVEVGNKQKINIINGFLSFRKWGKDGKNFTTWEIVVTDFESDDFETAAGEPSGNVIADSFVAIDEEVPF